MTVTHLFVLTMLLISSPVRAALEVTTLTFAGQIPPEAPGIETVTVDGKEYDVAADGSFAAEVSVPTGQTAVSFVIEATDGDNAYARQVEMSIEDRGPPIDGLDVSKAELEAFLGGKSGVLTWVDAGDRIQVLDFGDADPQVRQLSNDVQCVNPLISPDGTRIVYSRGSPAGTKEIRVRTLDGAVSRTIASGDLGYWHFSGADEYIIWAEWSDKQDNGAGAHTWQQKVVTGGIEPDGAATLLYDRAMDAGPNGDATWLGQVYDNVLAYDVARDTEVATTHFFLMDGTVADHQTCNGSMPPNQNAQLMLLVIPHDWVRIFTYDALGSFRETSRFVLPPTMTEWGFPDWSTDPEFFTAALRSGGINLRLYVVKIAPGEVVPEMLAITTWDESVSYSHLWTR